MAVVQPDIDPIELSVNELIEALKKDEAEQILSAVVGVRSPVDATRRRWWDGVARCARAVDRPPRGPWTRVEAVPP